jgi:hypothetical protein
MVEHPRRLLLAGVLLAFVALGCHLLPFPTPIPEPTDPGPRAAEQFIRDYIEALNANDPARLATHLGIPVNAADVTARLERYGNRGLTKVSLAVRSEFPRIYNINITATAADGTSVPMYEVIEWTHGEGWYMAALPPVTPSPT